ncbi:MAG: trigger factor [Oscillospiraceae bacterium]|nr:trigger factor [Oscillospiraceae bacterium]
MNVKSAEKKENSTVELLLEFSAEEFDAAVEKVYRKSKSGISVPGFRKGKAPRKVIEGMYGASIFYEDAVEDLYPDAYDQAVKEQNLQVVARPSVDIVSVGKEGLTLKVTVTVKPEVQLGAYRELTAPKAEINVTEQDIEREMQPLVDRATRLVSVERPAETGDTVVLDFAGTIDGEAFDGGTGTGYELELGSHTFVPGFEDGVVGMSAGEEKDIPITFPKEYTPDLAEKQAVFHVTAHEVKAKELPVLDDEFAKDVSEFETLEELKKDLGDKLRQRLEEEANRAFENALMKQVCENMQVDLPDAMVDYRVDEMLGDFSRNLSSQGISVEEYMKYMGTDIRTIRSQMRPHAQSGLLTDLALEAVTKAEGMAVTEEELEAEILKRAPEYGKEPEEFREMVNREALKEDILMGRARDLILSTAKVGESPAPEEKAEKEEKGEKKTARKKTAAKKESGSGEESTEAAAKKDGDGEEKPKKAPAKKPAAKKAAEEAPAQVTTPEESAEEPQQAAAQAESAGTGE